MTLSIPSLIASSAYPCVTGPLCLLACLPAGLCGVIPEPPLAQQMLVLSLIRKKQRSKSWDHSFADLVWPAYKLAIFMWRRNLESTTLLSVRGSNYFVKSFFFMSFGATCTLYLHSNTVLHQMIHKTVLILYLIRSDVHCPAPVPDIKQDSCPPFVKAEFFLSLLVTPAVSLTFSPGSGADQQSALPILNVKCEANSLCWSLRAGSSLKNDLLSVMSQISSTHAGWTEDYVWVFSPCHMY